MLSGAAVQRLPAAPGMVSAAVWVCVRLLMCVMAARLYQKKSDLRENLRKKTNSLLNRFWSCHASLTLLNRYFLLNIFS